MLTIGLTTSDTLVMGLTQEKKKDADGDATRDPDVVLAKESRDGLTKSNDVERTGNRLKVRNHPIEKLFRF